jgi:hypothetical protein
MASVRTVSALVGVALLAMAGTCTAQGVSGPPESWITPDNFAYDESTVYSLELNTDYSPTTDFAADAYTDGVAEANANGQQRRLSVHNSAGGREEAPAAATLWGMNAAGVGAAVGAGLALVLAGILAVVNSRRAGALPAADATSAAAIAPHMDA